MLNDLVIIGGGPAGAAGGVYAARKKLKTVLITEGFGGQSLVSPEIQNWLGEKSISGDALAEKLRAHVTSYVSENFVVKEGKRVTTIKKRGANFLIKDNDGEEHASKTLLVATGAARRKLKVPGAAEFEQKGLTYCATCDAPLFGEKDVAVIGGGNAGFETVSQLFQYAKSVTLLQHNDQLKADAVIVERVRQNPKMKIILNAETQEIKGEQFVTGLVYKDAKTGEQKELAVEGVFVEIGIEPNTELVKDLVELNRFKMIVVNHQTQRSSLTGIWAAGDCTDTLYHQNNISAGDAVKAVEDIYKFVHLEG